MRRRGATLTTGLRSRTISRAFSANARASTGIYLFRTGISDIVIDDVIHFHDNGFSRYFWSDSLDMEAFAGGNVILREIIMLCPPTTILAAFCQTNSR